MLGVVGGLFFGSLEVASAQSGTGYSLSAPSTVPFGDSINIQWTVPSNQTTRRDWIGLYETGAPNNRFLTWTYVADSSQSGSVSLSYSKAGTYEARYLVNNGYTSVAKSSTITIGDGRSATSSAGSPGAVAGEVGSYQVTVTASTYQVGNRVQVSWQTPDGKSSKRDWIGLYRSGSLDRQFEEWAYIPDSDSSGTVSFSVREAGTYEVRLLTNNGYTRVATSNSFVVSANDNSRNGNGNEYSVSVPSNVSVGNTITILWSAPNNRTTDNDWIGLYKVGARNNQFLEWTYVSNTSSNGEVSLSYSVPGTYEARYLVSNGYTSVARSNMFTLRGSANDGSSGGQCTIANVGTITNYPARSGPVIAFGDSLTSGVGASVGQDYPNQLSRLLDVPIQNMGISGNTTRDALLRLEQDVLSNNPAVVIVWLGGNDILQRYYERVREGVENPGLLESARLLLMRITGKLPEPSGITEDESFANIQTTVERIQARGAVVIVVGFSGGVFDSNLEERYKQVAENTNALYVPNVMRNVIGRPSLMSDLVHPNNEGYAIVAERIGNVLACTL